MLDCQRNLNRQFLLAAFVGILCFVSGSTLLVAHAASFQVDTSGTLMTSLASYYKMEGTSTDAFASNNGTDNNVSYNGSYGYESEGANFQSTNTSNIDLGNPASLAGTSSISIALWYKRTTTQDGAYGLVTKTDDAGARTYGLYVDGSSGHAYSGELTFVAYSDGSNGTRFVETYDYLNDTNWHFVAITFNPATKAFSGYVDATSSGWTSVADYFVAGHSFDSTSHVVVGARQGGAWYANADIDEVGIWNKTLSSQEVTDLYSGGEGDTLCLVTCLRLSSFNQYKSDATTTIVEGGRTDESTVVFGATLKSSTTSTVQLQVEVQPAGSNNFTNTSTVSSVFVSPGSNATATYTGANGDYHWQARAIDVNGVTSTWQPFGVAATSTDFEIDVTSTPPRFQKDTSGTLMTSLVSYYQMEGSSTDSINLNNGTDYGGTSYGTSTGKIVKGVAYNGSSGYTDLGNPVNLASTSSISIALWYKRAATQDSPYGLVTKTDDGGERTFALYVDGSTGHAYSGELTFAAYSDGGNGTRFVETYDYLNDTNWHFVAITFNPATKAFTGRVDGSTSGWTSVADFFTSGATFDSTSHVVIGARQGPAWYANADIDEVGVWNKVLSGTEISDLWNGGSGDTLCTTKCGPTLSSLNQYKSDATTQINNGSSTTESYVTFGATLNSPGTSTLRLDVEVRPSSTAFTGTPNYFSDYVASGTFATAVYGTSTLTYPRDPESSSNGSFHWQARVEASSTGATSTWQTPFGESTATGTVDFKINTVPEYGQKAAVPWPSSSNATDAGTGWWHGQTYDNGTSTCGATIGFCGCAISSVSMWLRYYGITTDHDGNDVNPGRLNTWLRNPVNAGYNFQGDLNYDQVPLYASSSNGGTIIYDTTSSISGSYTTLKPYIDPLVTSSTPNPVILYEQNAPEGTSTTEHTVIATGLAYNAGTSTYTIRDPVWYNTQYLNQATSTDTSSTVNGYSNKITRIHIFYDPPSRPSLDDFSINLPNALILVDSQGRRTGKDPMTGVDYHEIPGTTYFEEFHSGQLYFHSPPTGQYTIYILGGQTGEYHLDSWVDDGEANHPHKVFSGNIQAGTMIAYTQNYDSAKIPSSTPIFQDTASSTESITSAPAENLPPPPVPVPVVQTSPPPSPPAFFYPAVSPGPATSTTSNTSSTVFSSTFMQTATSSPSSATSSSQ